MTTKQAFHQSLIGKWLVNDPENETKAGPLVLQWYGLKGKHVEIVGAWIHGEAVRVLVVDATGHQAELYATHFLLREPETSPSILCAVEFGYKACERGLNIEATIAEVQKIMSNIS